MKQISSKLGFKGFYRGFVPAFILYLALKYDILRELTYESYYKYRYLQEVDKL